MAKVFTSEADEVLIATILQRRGLGAVKVEPKWRALRLALALSLRQPEAPDAIYDDCKPRKGEYALAQLTGEGQDEDFTDAYCALLSVYHEEDLFRDDGRYVKLLQRHIRRGLAEIERGWRDSHDFHEYLYQELFSRPSTSSEGAKAEDLSDLLRAALRDNAVAATIDGLHDGARLQCYQLTLADAAQWRGLQRSNENISVALGKGAISIVQGGAPGRVQVLVPKPRLSWAPILWKDVQRHVPKADSAALGVTLGVETLGEPFGFDLSEAPHVLLGGTTGSGKSVCMHVLLSSLLLHHTARSLNLCLVDPKRVEFAVYGPLPHLRNKRVLNEADEALDAMHDLVREMESRESQLARLGVKTLAEWRARDEDAPPYVVLAVEELADLLLQRPEVEAPLVRLAQKGRSSGIHLILATQRPDSVTFSGLLRSNIPSRIALAVQKSSESRIILDEVGAESLLGKGDMLVRLVGGVAQRVHGAWISNEEVVSVVTCPP